MRAFVRGLCVATLVLGLVAPVVAQEPPEVTFVIESDVKPDMVEEYEDLIKHEVNPALKKAGIAQVLTLRTAVFGDLYSYTTLVEVPGFSVIDGGSPFVRALGQEAANRLDAKVRGCLNGRRMMAVTPRNDLSLEPTADANLTIAVFVDVRPDKTAEWEALLRDELVPAFKKAGANGYFVNQIRYGGPGNRWVLVSMLSGFAELDQPHPVVQALGPEGAQKLFAKVGGVIQGWEAVISSVVPELSFNATDAAGGAD